jgi:peptidyl-prolyl cis-trans isomerase SurA
MSQVVAAPTIAERKTPKVERNDEMSANPRFLKACRRFASAAGLAMVLVAGAQSAAVAQQVVAFVNGDPITAFDLDQRIKLNSLGGQKPPARQDVLDELVNEKIKMHLLKRFVFEVSDKEVEESYATMARRMRLNSQQLTELLAKAGVGPATLKARIKADVVWGAVVRGKFQSSLQINEKELHVALASRNKDEKNTVGYEYSLRPILFIVPRGAAENAIETRRKEADALRSRFQSCDDGIAFARQLKDVAVREPITRTSADLTPQLREILDGIAVGKLTTPETTQQGIEMFALCGKKQTKVDAAGMKELREEMFSEQFQAHAKRFLNELRRTAMIEYK